MFCMKQQRATRGACERCHFIEHHTRADIEGLSSESRGSAELKSLVL